ncbi:hypothetical protein HK101_005398 [Irineochytrium annulatum]|nr:hypothetical protein HK101_005398 [Irineochytrium annulatum]
MLLADTIFLKAYSIEDLPEAWFEWCFQLVKTNLYDLYVAAKDTGWTDRRKRAEMSEADGKYILAFSDEAMQQPVGYVYFQFCMEENAGEHEEDSPVIYWSADLSLNAFLRKLNTAWNCK